MDHHDTQPITTTDAPAATPVTAYTTEERKKHLMIVLFAAVTFIGVMALMPRDGGGYDMSGRYIPASSSEMTRARFITAAVGFPMISAFLALFVALFPFRKLPWSKKYERAFYLTMIGLYGIGIVLVGLILLLKRSS